MPGRRAPRFAEGEPREVPIISGLRKRWVTVHFYREAREAGEYRNDVGQFLDGYLSSERFYHRWAGRSLGGLPYQVDPDVLEWLGLRGDLRFDEFYRDTS